jgi:hypothetical protein
VTRTVGAPWLPPRLRHPVLVAAQEKEEEETAALVASGRAPRLQRG